MKKLYLKTHNITGLKYLGYTSKEDAHSYEGSGKRWIRHIKKHGYDVTTQILFETEDAELFKQVALEYSEKWDVVSSKEFANLMNETGSGGDNSKNIDYDRLGDIQRGKPKKPNSEETKKKKSEAAKKRGPRTPEEIRAMSEARKKLVSEGWVHPMKGKKSPNASKALLGVKKSPEHIANMHVHSLNKENLVCPHCGKEGNIGNMKRWHFDKCKHKIS